MTLRRDGPTDTGLTVRYLTVDGTARAGDGDYVAMTTGTLTFNVGEVQRSISVRVLDDATPEGKEMFYVKVYEIIGRCSTLLYWISFNVFDFDIYLQ